MSHVANLQGYAEDVIAGRVLACKWVRLACQRHLEDLRRARCDRFPYVFDEVRAEEVCEFIELLPHTKGRWARPSRGDPDSALIRIEPWQAFFLGVLFGWVHQDTGLRRFRTAYMEVPRKNGKSILAAGTGLRMFAADGEYGAEVYSGATSEKQAWEVFRPAKQMAERTPEFLEHYGVQVNAKTLSILHDGARFEPIIGQPGDGASPSCAIIDEYHEHGTAALRDTMRTGMGAREQPLELVITTAGDDLGGPCYALHDEVTKILEGSIQDDRIFGVIYTIDEDDDWSSDEALIKANPNYGISVGAEFLREQRDKAVRDSTYTNTFKTKHLDVWVGARTAFVNMDAWNKAADETLVEADFGGEPCWLALDLNSKIDLAAKVKVFRRDIDGVTHYYLFGVYYLPEERARGKAGERYSAWGRDGHLVLTDGVIIDYNAIRSGVVADRDAFDVEEVAFDPWGATQLATQVRDEDGMEVVEIPQRVAYLSEPMKEMQALILAGRLHHDGNPVMTWMMSNLTAKADANDNVFPRKEAPENKIDGPVALIMALGRALVAPPGKPKESVYERRGVRVF